MTVWRALLLGLLVPFTFATTVQSQVRIARIEPDSPTTQDPVKVVVEYNGTYALGYTVAFNAIYVQLVPLPIGFPDFPPLFSTKIELGRLPEGANEILLYAGACSECEPGFVETTPDTVDFRHQLIERRSLFVPHQGPTWARFSSTPNPVAGSEFFFSLVGSWRDTCRPLFDRLERSADRFVVRLKPSPAATCLHRRTGISILVPEIAPSPGIYEVAADLSSLPSSDLSPLVVEPRFRMRVRSAEEPQITLSTDSGELRAVMRQGSGGCRFSGQAAILPSGALDIRIVRRPPCEPLPPDGFPPFVALSLDVAPGAYRYTVSFSDQRFGSAPFVFWGEGLVVLEYQAPQGLLDHDRFIVAVEWRDHGNDRGFGRPRPLSGDALGFWFFREDNVEMLVKLLNGCALNGHYWLLASAATDVEYTLRVSDRFTGRQFVHANRLASARRPRSQSTSSLAARPPTKRSACPARRRLTRGEARPSSTGIPGAPSASSVSTRRSACGSSRGSAAGPRPSIASATTMRH